MTPRRPILILLPLLALISSACNNLSVGADNRYGQTRGGAVVHVPIDKIPEQVSKAIGSPSAPDFARPLAGQVVSVLDGATLTIRIDGSMEHVRLIGIEAPDASQSPWGIRAREALRTLLEGKPVRLETDITVRDRDKRLLAYVFVGDLFVNLEMIRQGEAVVAAVPPNVAHVKEYRTAEEEARAAGKGVWERRPVP